jgi:small nuclear ribonucleoprotein (snRNP)-like protein
MKTPHTSTYKGKRVYVRLKSGERIVGKFQDKTGNFVTIDGRKIPKGDIKAFTIYRNRRVREGV